MNFFKKGVQRSPNLKPSLKKVFLIAFFTWFFSSVLMEASEIFSNEWFLIYQSLSEGRWMAFVNYLNPTWLNDYNGLGIPLTLAIIIGFYLGLKRGGKFVFKYPIVCLSIAAAAFILYTVIVSRDFTMIWLSGFYTMKTLFIFLSFSLIIAASFYYRKEKFLFIIAIIFFISLVIGAGAAGKILSNKFSSENLKFKNNMKETISSLKVDAINKNDAKICEEMRIFYETERQKIPWWMQVYTTGDFQNNYSSCIEEIAVTLNSESLCSNLKIFDSGPGSEMGQCEKKVFLENFSKCKEENSSALKEACIKKIAIKTGDTELCRKIYDGECSSIIAIKTNNPNDCYAGYDDFECVTEIAVNTRDVSLCKKISWQIGMVYGCIEKVALKIGDPKLCDEIGYESSQAMCYQEFKK